VDALINDTVGTQLAGCYQEVGAYCFSGAIVGTGSNCCYMEKVTNIEKYTPSKDDLDVGCMIINMECGNYGSRRDRIRRDLPMTEFDYELDDNSNNKNNQLLEKQISGMYLGEITRLILRKYMKKGMIFKDHSDKLNVPYAFSTEEMSRIEVDEGVAEILSKHGIHNSTHEERTFVRAVSHLVARRAAQLAAMQIAAIYKQFVASFPSRAHGSSASPLVAAVDGSVFEKYTNFQATMTETLSILLGHNVVKLVLAKDGSGNGAALAGVAAKQ